MGYIVDAKIRASDKDLPVQTESEVCDCNHQKNGGEWKSLFFRFLRLKIVMPKW